MTEADVDGLEQALGVTLPPMYRQTMISYPFSSDHPAAEDWLPPDVDRVLSLRVHRYRSRGETLTWPAHYVVIGTDGGEERYVLDVSRDPSPVLAFELETSQFRSVAADINGFLKEIGAWYEEIVADEKAMEQRTYRQPGESWWRFFWR